MAVVHLYQRPRRFRSYPGRPFSPSNRSKRQRKSVVATIRPLVLIGVLTPLCVSEGLGLDIFSAWNRFAGTSGEHLTLCGRWVQSQCVVDGDTIHYAGLKIRLEDIDAPETLQYKCEAELARGKRATNRLLELINAGPFEVVNRSGQDEDRYGRKLRTIERDGRSLGEILIAEGLARRWDGRRGGWCG
jgi:Staphylococcal nuclease homologue